MHLFQNRYWLFNFFAVIGITAVMAYFIVQHNLSGKSEAVKFVNLTNADIEQIMSVKAEMQAAKIQSANIRPDLDN